MNPGKATGVLRWTCTPALISTESDLGTAGLA